MLRQALVGALQKLSPLAQIRNPVMFTVWVGSLLTTGLFIKALWGQVKLRQDLSSGWPSGYGSRSSSPTSPKPWPRDGAKPRPRPCARPGGRFRPKNWQLPNGMPLSVLVSSSDLRKGDVVLVEAGQFIPGDGEVIEGVASVDESAITGESAPVIRESGGDRSAVTGGTRVLSDWLIIRITTNPGEAFLDFMISLVEGAKRRKTPNEIALNILLAALCMVFLLVCTTLLPFSLFSVATAGKGQVITVTVLAALFVCLAPTTIGGLLSAIGIAGMDRLIQANVIAMSGRAVEAAGDVDVLLLDKTGTITLGNRQATEFIPAAGVSPEALANAAQLASLADETPEGRSIVVLAKEKFGLRGRDIRQLGAKFVPFSAQTRMSGVNLDGRQIRKGSPDAIIAFVEGLGGFFPAEVRKSVRAVAQQGATPWWWRKGPRS